MFDFRKVEVLESDSFIYDDTNGYSNGDCFGIYYRENERIDIMETHVYATTEEEAVGVFLMEHPQLSYDNIIEHIEL